MFCTGLRIGFEITEVDCLIYLLELFSKVIIQKTIKDSQYTIVQQTYIKFHSHRRHMHILIGCMEKSSFGLYLQNCGQSQVPFVSLCVQYEGRQIAQTSSLCANASKPHLSNCTQRYKWYLRVHLTLGK